MEEQKQNTVRSDTTAAKRRGRPITHEAIERLLQLREQIIKETNGYIFEDSAVVVRREREKRTRELMGEVTGQYDEDLCAENADEERA